MKNKFTITVLVFIKNQEDKFLMLKRAKKPNINCWTPIGGKMKTNESPYECAIRETFEETNMQINHKDLHLFGIISNENKKDKTPYLMFMFNCYKKILLLPEVIEEGSFQFFTRNEINELNDKEISKIDKKGIWKYYDQYHNDFILLKISLDIKKNILIIVEDFFNMNIIKL